MTPVVSMCKASPLKASPVAAMAGGVGLVPEDRRLQGLVMELSIGTNIALASLGRLQRFAILRRAAEYRFAREWATRLRLKFGRLSNSVSTLSGGNQQKVVLAKWLSRRPQLLIVDEPTRAGSTSPPRARSTAFSSSWRRKAWLFS